MHTLTDFQNYFSAIVGRSERTCIEYLKEAKVFAEFLGRDLKSATRKDVEEYIIHCYQKGNADSTRARKISALRSVYDYLFQRGLIDQNPLHSMPRPKVRRSMPVFLSLDDSKALIASARANPDSFYSARNTCMIVLLLNCGLRLAELSRLSIKDVYDDTLKILGKGDKERFVYLNQSCVRAVQRWLHYRRSNDDLLFVAKSGIPLKPASVATAVKTEISRAGLSADITTHKLRHTCATLLYRYGRADIRVLQEVLGHESISTTQIYTHIVEEQMVKTMSSHPLADF